MCYGPTLPGPTNMILLVKNSFDRVVEYLFSDF